MPEPTRERCSTPFDAGHVFSSIDALGGPVALSFSATGSDGSVTMGEDVVMKGPMTFAVQSNAPDGATISLLRDGSPVTTVSAPRLEQAASEPGVYRVEIQWPGAPGKPPVPWIVSNPIYVLVTSTTDGDRCATD